MRRLKTAFIAGAMLPLLLLAGCSEDDLGGGKPVKPTGNGGDIQFEIGFASQGSNSQTRVTTASDFTSTWEEGDEIGLFACTAGTPLAASGNYIHNVKLTYSSADGGSWNLDSGVELWWPGSSGKLDFYAYYPYDDNNGSPASLDPNNIAFTVKTDQRGNTGGKSNYNLSDLLTAKSDNSGNGWSKGQTVALSFSHALAMVQVSIPGGKGWAGGSDGLTVALRGVKTKSTLNLGAQTVELDGSGNDPQPITMYRLEQPIGENYIYRALVPAQHIAQGTSLFFFDHEGRELFTDGALTAAVPLTTGQAEKFTRTLPATLIETALIPAGTFKMGSSDGSKYNIGDPLTDVNTDPNDSEANSDERPQHWVKLTEDFYLSKYQVTNAQYAAFLNANNIGNPAIVTVGSYGYQALIKASSGDSDWGLHYNTNKWEPVSGYENHPAIYVTWYGAKAYADWIGGFLPTEAQWEYACRGGTTTAFYFGDDANAMGGYGWYLENSNNSTKPVGQKQPNAYGLYDMHGNVLEWCADWYDFDYYNSSPDTDPTGPTSGSSRVLRGGSWAYNAQNCRSACRHYMNPDNSYDEYGFRVGFVPQSTP